MFRSQETEFTNQHTLSMRSIDHSRFVPELAGRSPISFRKVWEFPPSLTESNVKIASFASPERGLSATLDHGSPATISQAEISTYTMSMSYKTHCNRLPFVCLRMRWPHGSGFQGALFERIHQSLSDLNTAIYTLNFVSGI